uniref:F-box domain-containing protein n=2 Tax=Rhizophora mucronata TaxID=61149 RepID=A0A2P2JBB6_RHIMU
MDERRLCSSSFDQLPKEVVLEILYRLPPICAIRCKCVCRLWFSLISHASFSHQYLLRSNLSLVQENTFALYIQRCSDPNNNFVLYHDQESWYNVNPSQFSLNFNLPPQSAGGSSVLFLEPSNGIVLHTTFSDCNGEYPYSAYSVLNPLTKQWLLLPPLPPDEHHTNALVGLVCDPRDHMTSRFKVVRIVFPGRIGQITRSLDVVIFDSETSHWSKSTVSCQHRVYFCTLDRSSAAMEYKGILFWKILMDDVLFAYDPCNSHCQCSLIPLPEECDGGSPRNIDMRIGMSQGHIQIVQMEVSLCCYVWRLEDHRAPEWCLEHKIFLNESVVKDSPFSASLPSLLALDPVDSNIVYFQRHTGMLTAFASFNLQTRQMEVIHCFEDGSLFSYKALAFVLPRWPTLLPKLLCTVVSSQSCATGKKNTIIK